MSKNRFYVIPAFNGRYSINTNGEVKENQTNTLMEIYHQHEYPEVNLDGRTYHIHRLLAGTFHPIPDRLGGVKKLDVNHIDGNKHNNALDNLEWVTRSENCLHAYATGLRDDNRHVLVKDTRDNSIREFYSLHECGRAFDANPTVIWDQIKSTNNGNLCWGFYQFIYKGDLFPAVPPKVIRNGDAKLIRVINVKTGEKEIYSSIGLAARTTGFSHYQIKTASDRKTVLGTFTFEILESYDNVSLAEVKVDDARRLRTLRHVLN